MGMAKLRTWARGLKRETLALYLATRDPRTPWYAKMIAGCVVAYALSPVDLIPDFVPVLGYLDDLILVPLGIALAVRLIPPGVMAEARERAAAQPPSRRANWIAGGIIVGCWVALLIAMLAQIAGR